VDVPLTAVGSNVLHNFNNDDVFFSINILLCFVFPVHF